MTPSGSSYPTTLTEHNLNRFLSKIQKTDGCWIWKSAIAKNGYGVFHLAGKVVYAHRLSFAIHRGYLSTELVIDHLCRTRNCVNPSHMRELSREENVRIGRYPLREKTHCVRGHELVGNGGRRVCKLCHRISCRKYEAKKRLKPRN